VTFQDPTPTASSPSATASRAATPGRVTSTPTPGSGLSRGVLSSWKGCGGGFECATLTVPLDDTKPALGDVAIAVTRHPATGSNRVGSLFVNPGGPGASAVEYLQGSYQGFPATVRDHFDMVAFDPRGVGRTVPVRCETTQQLDAYFHVDPVPDSPQERAELDKANKDFAVGCQKRSGRVLPYVSTKIVAQDLERFRIALGDPKLTYLGYSYGTAIGASYLDQFASHVRAMVLDGALDPSNSWDQLLAGQSRGFDVALGAFLADCEKQRCAFRKAVSGDLTKAYDDLAATVEHSPLSGKGNRVVGPAEFSYGVGQALYSTSLWPYLASGLAEAVKGKGTTLLALNDEYLERTDQGYANIIEANLAVNCIDRPWPRTGAPYQQLARRVGKQYPRFGPAIALSGLGCAVWPVPPQSTPRKVTAPGSPPVVVIGNTRDPATPYSWAVALAKQLSRGVLLTHVGDGHTVYRNSAPACIKDPVNAYLVSLTTPAASTC
jgi:pimeloyl-ACP methyl ester carboxylesterase